MARVKILLVDGEVKAAERLRQGLAEAGFKVDLARHHHEGLHLLRQDAYDLVIFDAPLTTPGLAELRQWLDRERMAPKLLFLTASDHLKDCGVPPRLDPCDHLAKPFSFSELLARVRTLVHSERVNSSDSMLRVADLELDLVNRLASRQGRLIALTARELALLESMMRRQGEVLPASLIAAHVWDMPFGHEKHMIEAVVRRLRGNISPKPEVNFIHAVRGMGYVFEAPDSTAVTGQ